MNFMDIKEYKLYENGKGEVHIKSPKELKLNINRYIS